MALARIRLDDPLLPPKPTQAYIFVSEVFTLKYLESTGVPVPKVFHFATESSEVGMPFWLTEKLKGSPLRSDTTLPSQRTRVLEQLADVFLTLEKHPFHSTASMYRSDRLGKMCRFAQPQLFKSPDTPLG